ncbi:hypothetical protein ONE63_008158 [Megalurothrips usitatus]|uniref:Peptidoglycan recognition protein family domain-containing protein n=1 Tax=Megalurothrips usitatus TaxID=439358 RepID=A0AAV7XKA6_9NEOP|nr:hypothetical protein ONE63_008158 [Megalurothrips usitatus]
MDVQGWADIAYHYLVASDGRVYEGRGWDAVGAIAHGWNWRAVGVAAIGDFTDAAPTSEQVKAMQRLLERGVALGKLRPGYRLYGKCQVSNKASPGAALMRELRTWSHWHNNSAEMHDYC